MIQLIVNGISMDLPTGLQLEREIETTIFNREMEATDFVYPVDLPLTDTNKKALRHPELIAKDLHTANYDCELIIDGIYGKGVLYIQNVSTSNHIVRISISGDYGGFLKEAKAINLNELSLGGVRTVGAIDTPNEGSEFLDPTTTKCLLFYTPCTTGDHIEDVMNGVIETDYHFYRAVDETANITNIHDKQSFLDMDSDGILPEPRSIINPYFFNNSGDKGIIDPVKAYIETTFMDTTLKTHDRYFWVPFFKLIYVLKQCFIELGYDVYSPTIDADDDWKYVTLYNTYSINKCSKTEAVSGGSGYVIRVTHQATTIDGRNHVPKMTVTDFLREIGKNFNLQYIINYSTREVRINVVGDITPANNRIVNLTNKVTPLPEINYDSFNPTNGYHFKFEGDSQDGAIFEKVIEGIDGLSNRGNYSSYVNLSTISSPVDLDVAFVMSERAWYQYLSDPGVWYFYGYDKPEHITSNEDNLQPITSKAVPVPSKRFDAVARMQSPKVAFMQLPNPPDLHEVIYEHDQLMPYSKLGMEGIDLLGIQRYRLGGIGGNAKDVYANAFTLNSYTLKPYQPHLCNYIGFGFPSVSAVAATHPCGSSGVKDSQGVTRAGIPLYWYGADNGDGLYTLFWKRYVEKLKGSAKVEYKLKWDADLYKDFDLQTDFIEINNILFLCDKAQIIFPFPRDGKITLVRY